MGQQVKLPSPVGMQVCVPGTSHFPSCWCTCDAADDGPNTWIPVTHEADPNGAPGSYLIYTTALAAKERMDQEMEELSLGLSLSFFLSNKIIFKKYTCLVKLQGKSKKAITTVCILPSAHSLRSQRGYWALGPGKQGEEMINFLKHDKCSPYR